MAKYFSAEKGSLVVASVLFSSAIVQRLGFVACALRFYGLRVHFYTSGNPTRRSCMERVRRQGKMAKS